MTLSSVTREPISCDVPHLQHALIMFNTIHLPIEDLLNILSLLFGPSDRNFHAHSILKLRYSVAPGAACAAARLDGYPTNVHVLFDWR
jgi:hypothetical protein